MAKAKVKFQLDIQGGAVVLQQMCRPLIQDTTKRIQIRASEIAKKSSLNNSFDRHYRVGAPNKHGGQRYYGHVGIKTNNKKDYVLARTVLDQAGRSIKIH